METKMIVDGIICIVVGVPWIGVGIAFLLNG